MTKEEKLKSCVGCEQDFYNGKNPLGVQECWHLKDMVLIRRRRVHVDEMPPWTATPTLMPRCYEQKRYIFVSPERTC